jgi:hypothetical protein
MPASITNCRCNYVPPRHFDYDRQYIGVDETDGRFAEVAIDTCKYCGTKWINYFYEVEGFSGSGRWYRGIIGEEAAATISASTAATWLEQLDQYMYGGSYFDSEGAYGRGRIS